MRTVDGRALVPVSHRVVFWAGLLLGVTVCAAVGCGDDASGTALPPGRGGGGNVEASVESGPDQAVTPEAAPDGGESPDVQETGPSCAPKTCTQLAADCGEAPDGCGGKVSCGSCAQGQICGGTGAPNQCGPNACSPKTCLQVQAECGLASDGCAAVIDCGGCAAPESCGGAGIANTCGCTPKNCSQMAANCGVTPDGCGGVIDCGTCPSGQLCGGGGANKCGTGSCAPKTCSQLGASCGKVSDTCSNVVDCGSCSGVNVCGGAGVVNQCGCTPRTCTQLGASCGPITNGCGAELDCGTCPSGDTCGGGGVANQCGCACTLPSATATCASGQCKIASCNQGFASCDLDDSNGCETDLGGDPSNCGKCGNGCSDGNACTLGDGCASGVCVPGTLKSCDTPPAAQCYEAIGLCDPATGDCGYTPQASGTGCNADNNACTQNDACDGAGNCVAGALKTCTTPPNTACYNASGTCNTSTGTCSYTTKSDGTACGTCKECTNGTCGNAPNGTLCGNACRYCSSGTCATRATGYQYDSTESHRCCGGNPVDISSDEANCGGCGLACASGRTCQTVSVTTSCSSHPASTTGRCTCAGSNAECPNGRNGLDQTCRGQTPYNNVCAPSTAEYCASGQSFMDISSCPNYCYYP